MLVDNSGLAWTLGHLGLVALYQSDDRQAVALAAESLALFREQGDTWGAALALGCLGLARYAQDDQLAQGLLDESLSLFRTWNDAWGIARVLGFLGHVSHAQGENDRAAGLLDESLILNRDLGDTWGMTVALGGLGKVASDRHDYPRTLRLLGASNKLRKAIRVPLFPVDYARFERILATARAELGESAAAAALTDGETMSLEQAVEYALNVSG